MSRRLTLTGTPTLDPADGSCFIDAGDRVQVDIAGILDVSQGYLAVRQRPAWAAAAPPASGQDMLFVGDDATHRLLCNYDLSTTAWKIIRQNGAAAVQANSVAQTFAANTHGTQLFQWSAGDVSVFDAGAWVTSALAGTVPALAAAQFDLGTGGTIRPGREFTGAFYWVVIGTGPLSQAEGTAIVALGDSDPDPHTLPGSPTFMWGCQGVTYRVAPFNARRYLRRRHLYRGLTAPRTA